MTIEEIIEQLDGIVGTYEILIGNGVNSDILDVDDIEAIREAISALSENKGEWIAYDHGMGLVYLKCPFCGTTIDKRHVEHNFCGKCGAKLSGEKSGFER